MLKQLIYEGNVVELKKDIITNDVKTTFTKGEIDVITKINYHTTTATTGIIIYFDSNKILISEDATNYSSWLRRHFKLTL